MAKSSKPSMKFVVKRKKAGRGENDPTFFVEVGRLTLWENEKGVSGTLYLHMVDGDFAVFPVQNGAARTRTEDAPTAEEGERAAQ